MAYNRYRKGYSRRYKKRSTFTRYNTYRNRSSKAQAYQIYSLNKKVNRLEAKTRPEFKTARKDAFMELTTRYQNVAQLWNHSIKYVTTTDGIDLHSDEIQKGLFCRLCGLTLWGNIKRTDANATHTAGFMRLIIFQYRQCRHTGASMTDMFSGYDDSTFTNMSSTILKEPFKDHISSTVKILVNRIYRLNNNDVNNVPFKISIPARRLLNFSMNSTDNFAKGDIGIVAIYGQDNVTSASAYKINVSVKLCYTDN